MSRQVSNIQFANRNLPSHSPEYHIQQLFSKYFSGEEYTRADIKVEVIEKLITYFDENQVSCFDTQDIIQNGRVNLDYAHLYDETTQTERIPVANFKTSLRDNPTVVLDCLSLSAHVSLLRSSISIPHTRLYARIKNYPHCLTIRDIKSNLVDKFVAIRGNITRVGSVRPLVQEMYFHCFSCQNNILCKFPDGQYNPPVICSAKCRNRQFNADRNSAIAVDWQHARLQEMLDIHNIEHGRTPSSIEIEMTNDLVDICVPGDSVVICGIVKARKPDVKGGGGRNKSIFTLYIDVNSVTAGNLQDSEIADLTRQFQNDLNQNMMNNGNNNGNQPVSFTPQQQHQHLNQQLQRAQHTAYNMIRSLHAYTKANNNTSSSNSVIPRSLTPSIGCIASGIPLSPKDLMMVLDVATHPSLFKLLVHSVCPAIFGHDVIKSGLLLGLFGGVTKRSSPESKVQIRGDPHILLIGEPGLGKSQLLRTVSKISPRSVYVTGNSSTTSGLTVSILREGRDNAYSLEPGALILSDRGVCCIDELDKMVSEQHALLEAMEQQTVSIAKAGVVCQLPARTSVLAAANPKGGHYDRSKTVAENIKMSMPLLSRFDLTFLMLDKADLQRDQFLSEHIVAIHSNRNNNINNNNNNNVRVRDQGTIGSIVLPDNDRVQRSRSIFGQAVDDANVIFNNNTNNNNSSTSSSSSSSSIPDNEQFKQLNQSLSSRLRQTPEELKSFEPLPHSLLRKYIAYAREFIRPRLSQEAKTVLQNFFISLRRRGRGQSGGAPITTRQLECLIRLTEARAKSELREVANANDAYDVIEMTKDTLFDIYSDEHGLVDLGRAVGVGTSTKQIIVTFMSRIRRLAVSERKDIFHIRELKSMGRDMGMDMSKFEQMIDALNNQNEILSKGNGNFKITSVDY